MGLQQREQHSRVSFCKHARVAGSSAHFSWLAAVQMPPQATQTVCSQHASQPA